MESAFQSSGMKKKKEEEEEHYLFFETAFGFIPGVKEANGTRPSLLEPGFWEAQNSVGAAAKCKASVAAEKKGMALLQWCFRRIAEVVEGGLSYTREWRGSHWVREGGTVSVLSDNR